MKKINIQLLAGMVSLFALSAHADLPYHFSAGDVIYADDVNDNFEYVDQSEFRHVSVDCASDSSALQKHLNHSTSPSYVYYVISGACDGGVVIYGDYVVLEKDENADSASIKVPDNATGEYHTNEAVYIRGSGFVDITGVEIGGGAAENNGISIDSSFLRMREGTIVHDPASGDDTNAIYAENSYIIIRADDGGDGGDIDINGEVLAQYSSTVYIRSDSKDINIDGEVNANHNSFLRIRDPDNSDGNEVNITGNVDVFHSSSINLRGVSDFSFIGVYHTSGANIIDSTFNGMEVWLGSNARIRGDSKTTGDIVLYYGGAEIQLAYTTSGTNVEYLNGHELILCNNDNFIRGYSDYGYSFGGTVRSVNTVGTSSNCIP